MYKFRIYNGIGATIVSGMIENDASFFNIDDALRWLVNAAKGVPNAALVEVRPHPLLGSEDIKIKTLKMT